MSAMNASYTDKIKRLCADAGEPGKASVFIAAGWHPARVEATLKREAGAGRSKPPTATITAAEAGLASMRRELARAGIKSANQI